MKPCCPTANMPNPEDLKKDAKEPKGDSRMWYLLGAWKYQELSEKKK